MKPRRVASSIGDLLRIFSIALVIPLLVALAYEPYDIEVVGLALPSSALVFAATAAAVWAVILPLKFVGRDIEDEDLQDREAYLTVGLGWLIVTAFGALPFLFSGLLGPVDAFFEAMSGLTTTGATVIQGDLEAVDPSIMMWRAEMQFLGGMGIIVLSIAVLARLTQGGLQLLQAEAPGPSVTRIRPKVAQTAKTLWLVYAALALLIAILLLAALLGNGMPLKPAFYEALLHTFTTVSTGGFSNHTASISFFESRAVEAIIIAGMLVAGSNFTLLYHASHGEWRRLVRDPEWRFYMGTVSLVTLASTSILWRASGWGLEALASSFRASAFTVSSLATSSGFATVDFAAWPAAAQVLLLILMLTGATAGSTSGGLKMVRILLLLRIVSRQVRRLLHPRAVIPIRLGGRVIREDTLMTVVAFFFAYLTIAMIGAIVSSLDPRLDLVSAVSGSISMMGNTGPALGILGPSGGYWDLTWWTKITYAFMMWFGRLEVFAALLLFAPSSWRN